MKSKLTARERKFVNEYLVDLNATQAAIRAGYSKKSARSIGSESLTKPDIQEYLQKRQAELQKKTSVTPERIIEELSHIAFDDIRNYLSFYPDADGQIKVDIKDSRKIDTRSIAEVSVGRDGQFKFKLYCKDNALAQLGKHLGMWDKKDQQGQEDGATGETGVVELPAVNPQEEPPNE